MVVEARDLAVVDQGFAEDASEAMPLDDDLLMPDGDDGAAPIEVDDSSEAATEDGVAPFDFDSLPDADKTALETRIRSALEDEFRQDKAELQRVKDQEVFQSRSREMARAKVYANYLKEMGVDLRDIKALEFEVQQETGRLLQTKRQQDQQQAQTQQTQASDAAHITSEIDNITGEMQKYATSVGLDISNEKVAAQIDSLWQPVAKAAKAYLRYPNEETWDAFIAAKDTHKAQVTSLGAAQKRRRSASQTNDAIDRQRNRGVQNTATGGNAAGAMSLTQMIEAVAAEYQQTGKQVPYREIRHEAIRRLNP